MLLERYRRPVHRYPAELCMNHAESPGPDLTHPEIDAPRPSQTEAVDELPVPPRRLLLQTPSSRPTRSRRPWPNILRDPVLKVLGRGGMGTVYLAEHKVMNGPVALKVIPADLTVRSEMVKCFRRESRGGRTPRTSPEHRFGLSRRRAGPATACFLAMEYVEVPTRSHWLNKHGPLPVAGSAPTFPRQAAFGLHNTGRTSKGWSTATSSRYNLI